MSPRSLLLSFFRAEELKNTGSLARDLLASERTFLAWARTGLGFIALGVALERVEALATISPTLLQLDDDGKKTRVAAGVLVGSGSLCVAHGTRRYFTVLSSIKRGMFRPNVAGITAMSGLSIGVAFAGAMLVWGNDGDGKKHDET